MIPFLKCKILRIPAVNPMLILEKVSPYKLYWIVQILFQKKKKNGQFNAKNTDHDSHFLGKTKN